jgi:hypothetical protein
VRPDRSVLIRKWVVSRILFGERANSPTAPHIGFNKSMDHMGGPIGFDDPTP